MVSELISKAFLCSTIYLSILHTVNHHKTCWLFSSFFVYRKWHWIFILVSQLSLFLAHSSLFSLIFSVFVYLFANIWFIFFLYFVSYLLRRSLLLWTLVFHSVFVFFILTLIFVCFDCAVAVYALYSFREVPLRLRSLEICVHLSRHLSRRSFLYTCDRIQKRNRKTLLISKFKCTTYLDHHSDPLENQS